MCVCVCACGCIGSASAQAVPTVPDGVPTAWLLRDHKKRDQWHFDGLT